MISNLKIISLVSLFAVLSCKQIGSNIKAKEDFLTEKESIKDILENGVMYEANIRQYSKEGTFEAFSKDIPQLKELGVKIIWLMPIFPISKTKRKATGGQFVSEKPIEEREKYLGSYYAVSDFKKINPEFGTLKEFRNLVKIAHDNGMRVILDWVPNHTGWDHIWLETHPEFYTKNEKREISEPLNKDGSPLGWADVADLDYNSKTLRATMISDMQHWLKNENIDGFRCDVAGSVPVEFWKEAIPQLRAIKEIIMLAEAWEPELLDDVLFDMAYGWDRHHAINSIAHEAKAKEIWDSVYHKDNKRYQSNDILLNFVTNHDENSWNGTVKERLGNASEVCTVFSYLIPGMPLIYSGQEYGLNHRLKFFEKDSIPKVKGESWSLLSKLGTLKNNWEALHGGKKAARYESLDIENPRIIAFKRLKNNQEIVFIGNFSRDSVMFKNTFKRNYINCLANLTIDLESDEISVPPYGYMLLERKKKKQ